MINSLSKHSHSMVRTAFKTQASKLSPLLMAQLLRRGRKPASKQANGGFTLVELLVVVVILGVLGAVGVPAYFAQVRTARINTANAAVMAAAKACSAIWITGGTFAAGSGVLGTCGAAGTASTFTVSLIAPSRFVGLTTTATAALATDGSITLTEAT
jgi:type IV pilus assembly protein PilA